MRFYIHVQETPNPNAVKFISQYVVKSFGKSQYHTPEEAEHNPLASALLALEGVLTVFFFDNYITLTKAPETPWDGLTAEVLELLQARLPEHDPDYNDPQTGPSAKPVQELGPELQQISDILDRTIRPYLAADGGGLRLVSLEDDILTIEYEGACGSCPSSAGGTLMAIESILRDEYHPDVRVVDGGQSFAPFSGY